MTDREKAIGMAYTGVCMLQGDKLSVFYDYVEEIMGSRIDTLGIAILAENIKHRSRPHFIKLCKDETPRPLQKPLLVEDLQHYVTEPVWTSRGWGVVGLHKVDECNYRYVIGFAHGWEWAEDVFRSPVWATKPTDEERQAAAWE